MSGGALAGLKVLDFSTLLPGPMATLFLAEAGAEVIKIERPGRGDDLRGYEPAWGADSVNFHMLNRGKKSVALDLKDPAARDRLRPLIAEADILVEQFRPGVMERLGLGYGAVSALNPGLIYCSITGYGQDGPARDEAGHDLNYIGRAGLLALAPGPEGAPVVPPALIADIAGGTWPAVVNILLALHTRERTGRGCHLDIAMAEGILPFLYWALGELQATGQAPRPGGRLVTGGSPRYRLYPAACGRLIAVAALEQKFWVAFTAAIGLDPALVEDAIDPEATARGVAAILGARPAADWAPILATADCCCTVVATLDEAVQDPQYRARGLFEARLEHPGGTAIALPVPVAPQFRAARGSARAPALGADTDTLLDPEREP